MNIAEPICLAILSVETGNEHTEFQPDAQDDTYESRFENMNEKCGLEPEFKSIHLDALFNSKNSSLQSAR